MDYYLNVLRQWKNFDGRSSKKEYWIFILVNFVITIALTIVEQVFFRGSGVISSLYGLFVLIPGIAVAIRRLHDVGKSGWMQLVIFIPLIGWIWILILMVKDGEIGRNQYGEDPNEIRF